MRPSFALVRRAFLRTHSTSSSSSSSSPRSKLKGTLSLDHFLQRVRVLSLYRTILRGTRRIADPNTKAETRRFARQEFERNRNVTDISHIRYLLSTGKTEWEGMERYIDGL
ncbi:LYR motif-containing protein 2 [Cladorrhinum samala]|uniref:LYR motif-containing protein 2 n=1 Tax=Cladorrhinum samala TaxID=585594 RepID=A0AAV9HPF2_9PEZI|nr:LYR motif-containing protein 2 [Cladorrhinum samala]